MIPRLTGYEAAAQACRRAQRRRVPAVRRALTGAAILIALLLWAAALVWSGCWREVR